MSTTGKVVAAVIGTAAAVGSMLTGSTDSTALSSIGEAAASATAQTKADEEGDKPSTSNTASGSK